MKENWEGTDAREKTKHKMFKEKPLLQQTFLFMSVLEKQPFLLFSLRSVLHLRTTERINTSVPHLTEWLREEHHFSPLLRDKGAALSCHFCLLHSKWQISYVTTDFASLHWRWAVFSFFNMYWYIFKWDIGYWIFIWIYCSLMLFSLSPLTFSRQPHSNSPTFLSTSMFKVTQRDSHRQLLL